MVALFMVLELSFSNDIRRKNMKYKLVVTDMDGTLLNSNNEVSEENKKALEKLRSMGVHVAIATGRMYTTAKIYAKHLGIVTPIICSNGAVVKNLGNDERIHGSPITKENCIKLIDMFKEHNTYFHFYSEDTIFGEKLEGKMLYFSEWGKTLKEEDRIKVKIVKDSREIIDSNEIIYKFGFQIDDPIKLKDISKHISARADVEIHKSFWNMVDIMTKGVNKGKAVERLGKSLGVKQEEIIAIGDNQNDMSMLEYAGLGVAMGNAEEDVKAIADYITDTNDNNGVAKVIEAMFKI